MKLKGPDQKGRETGHGIVERDGTKEEQKFSRIFKRTEKIAAKENAWDFLADMLFGLKENKNEKKTKREKRGNLEKADTLLFSQSLRNAVVSQGNGKRQLKISFSFWE